MGSKGIPQAPTHDALAFLIAQQRQQILPKQLLNRRQPKGVERGIQPFTEPLSILCTDCCQQLLSTSSAICVSLVTVCSIRLQRVFPVLFRQ